MSFKARHRRPLTLPSPPLGGEGHEELFGVVEDDAERVALARGDAADAVAEGDAVGAARAAGWAVAGGEDHDLAALEGDDRAG